MQVQTWGVVGTQQLKAHVLLNGVTLIQTNQDVDGIIKSMSVDEHLPNVISGNLTSALSINHCVLVVNVKLILKNGHICKFPSSLPLGNCTVLHSRECILEGSELHWTDRVFCDGEVYLTLGPNDTWTPHVPQAIALQVLWDQELGHTREERIRLQEACFMLMRELGLSVKTSGT